MATHSSILAWRIPWTEEPGGLQSMGLQNCTWLSTHTHTVHTYVYIPICMHICVYGFPGGSVVKNLPAMQETGVQSLGQEDPLEKEVATHSTILAWETPRTEEPGGYSPWGHKSQTQLCDWACRHIHVCAHHFIMSEDYLAKGQHLLPIKYLETGRNSSFLNKTKFL